MEEQKAHELFQHFSDVHAAARSGRGLGFNAGGEARARIIDSSDRWQPDARDDVLNSDSSRAGTSKRADRKHRPGEEQRPHSRRDKDANRADAGRHDEKQDRLYAARDADRRHDERGSKYTRDGRHSRNDDRHRSSRDHHHDSRSRHTDRESGAKHDRDQRKDRIVLHDRHSREERSRDHHSSGKVLNSRSDPSSHAKQAKVDFEGAIPGYAKMTPAERMKARTKLLLDKSAKQDDRDVKSGQWTRYVFNPDALLDEEGATPADGFSGDANAVSLRLPQAKAETKQRMQTAEEAHEAAIFGKSCSSAQLQHRPQQDMVPGMQRGLGLGAPARKSSPEAGEVDNEQNGTEDLPAYTLAAGSIVNAQPGLSWRERAALKRKQLAGS